jgi:hypothetical protein
MKTILMCLMLAGCGGVVSTVEPTADAGTDARYCMNYSYSPAPAPHIVSGCSFVGVAGNVYTYECCFDGPASVAIDIVPRCAPEDACPPGAADPTACCPKGSPGSP